MSCNLTILYRSKGTCILLKRVSLLYFFSTPGKVTKYSVFIILIYHSLKYMVLLCFLENVLLFFFTYMEFCVFTFSSSKERYLLSSQIFAEIYEYVSNLLHLIQNDFRLLL